MPISRPLVRFALRCALFGLPLATLGGWLERGLSTMENTYLAKREQLESRASTLVSIVTGSSGVFDGVDPDRLGVPAYNLANGNQTLHYDIEIVSRYLDKMPRLQLVILGQCYWSLGLDLRNTREAWRRHFYSVFWRVPVEEPERQMVTIQEHSYIALYTPVTAAQATLNGFHLPGSRRFLDNGWNPPEEPSAAQHAEGMSASWTRLRVEGQKGEMRPESQRRNVESLRAFSERLRLRGVSLALVWIPVSTEYTAWFGEEVVAAQRSLHQEMATRPNVHFFDYSSDPRFTNDDFANGDHLGPSGAVKFSDLLAAEVVGPMLKKSAEPSVGTPPDRR